MGYPCSDNNWEIMMLEWVGPIIDFIPKNDPAKLCKFPIRCNFHGPGAISRLWIFYIPSTTIPKRRQEEKYWEYWSAINCTTNCFHWSFKTIGLSYQLLDPMHQRPGRNIDFWCKDILVYWTTTTIITSPKQKLNLFKDT